MRCTAWPVSAWCSPTKTSGIFNVGYGSIAALVALVAFCFYFTWEQIILFLFSAVVAVAAVTLYWFFRSVRSGIVMRGVVDNADLVAMSGDDPVLVRRRAWIIGSVFAGDAGLFLAPT